MKSPKFLIVGALLFGSAVGQADDGRAPPPPPPTPHVQPVPRPPRAPRPPMPPRNGSGFNVQIQDGKIQISGLEGMVDAQINAALHGISNDPNIPPQVRAKVTARLEKVRQKVKKKIAKLDATDPERLGEELGALGEEIGAEMEQFGEEMEQFGEEMEKFSKKFEKDFGKQLGKVHVDVDHDDEDDEDDEDEEDDHDIDVAAVRSLGDLKLKAPQRDALRKLRADSEVRVANAQRELERAEASLQKSLENPNASDADIVRAIDAVSQQEAAIRKARILTWVNARRMLDDGQRKKVEAAAAKGKHR